MRGWEYLDKEKKDHARGETRERDASCWLVVSSFSNALELSPCIRATYWSYVNRTKQDQ
jgi:hypothetical protein